MKKVKVTLLAVIIVIIVAVILGWWEFLGKRIDALPMTTPENSKKENSLLSANKPLVSVLAKQLEIPWAIDFLPDQQLLVTERPGRIRLIDLKKVNPSAQLLLEVNDVAAFGEGGLLGIAVHPNFQLNHYVYIYYTYQAEGHYFNKVVRFQLENNKLGKATTIIDKIPGASIHDGGRVRFGPDGYLYITTGDAQIPEEAQNLNSLAGKILRISDNGAIPPDNPFTNSAIYSYGHRNPQGIAWDEHGNLWATEHGQSQHDEINLIKPGKNYGWPMVTGKEKKEGTQAPILESGNTTWAPSGAEIFQGKLYFCGLRGRTLYGFNLQTRELKEYFAGKLGRLREIKLGPNKFFYLTTSNRDGRGVPSNDDDMIIVVNPEKMTADNH